MSATVAALFVAKGGAYFNLPDVDPWDEARDARLYTGPHPVVAHPPCQLWVNFAALNFKGYGGEHNRPGNDGGCFASALASVRRWGGVLEHPASSNAWKAYSLPFPASSGWDRPNRWLRQHEWVSEVWQSAWAPGAQANVALLLVEEQRAAACTQLGASCRHASGRLVRPHQAHAREEGRERNAARVSRRLTSNRAHGPSNGACRMNRPFDDIGSRREDEAIKADLERRHAKLKNDIRSLPPREQLRLAADWADRGQIQWAIATAELAVARLKRGETP